MEKTIYYGSDRMIEKPKFGYGKPCNDYGIGFYCTQNHNMAKEWGVGIDHNGCANQYKTVSIWCLPWNPSRRGLKALWKAQAASK